MASQFIGTPELRNVLYDLILIHPGPIHLWYRFNQPRPPSLALLRVNKAIGEEARRVFYGQNCFDMSYFTYFRTAWTLSQIGSTNAKSIRHVRLYVAQSNLKSHRPFASRANIPTVIPRILKQCTNLTTLVLFAGEDVRRQSDPDNSKDLLDIAIYLKNTAKLRSVTVEIYERNNVASMEKLTTEYGWKITVVQNVEDPEWNYYWHPEGPREVQDRFTSLRQLAIRGK